MAIGAGGKTGKYQNELVRPFEVRIDPDFYGNKNKKILFSAQYAKFTQNKDLYTILMATLNAKLLHYIRGAPADVAYSLMEVREQLRNDEKIH